MTHSRNRSVSSFAAAASTGRFSATMPPNAETGSHARARANASAGVVAERHAAGGVVLDDDAGDLVVLLHGGERRLEIEEVVVAELLALEHLRERDGGLVRLAPGAVERARLVRVLAVAEVLRLRVDGGERLRGSAPAARRWSRAR